LPTSPRKRAIGSDGCCPHNGRGLSNSPTCADTGFFNGQPSISAMWNTSLEADLFDVLLP